MPRHRLKRTITTLVAWTVTATAVTFMPVVRADENLGQGYSRQGEFILFDGKRIDREGAHDIDRFAKAVGRKLTLCSDVDAASFDVLSAEYTKDKNKVYYKWISPGPFWVGLPRWPAGTVFGRRSESRVHFGQGRSH